MTTAELAELSRDLYSPVTLSLYLAAAFAYLYALTTTVGRSREQSRGRWARILGMVLAIAGIVAHVAHEVVRGLAQQRFPLGNMFEVNSLMALVGVIVGFTYLRFIRRREDLNGFVLLGGALVMASALLMYSEPGPLMPILDTWWRHFHVSLLVGGMGIFAAGFVFNSLYLLRDTGERELAREHGRALEGATVGAVHAGDLAVADESSGIAGRTVDRLDAAADDGQDNDASFRAALRAGVSVPKLVVGTFLGASVVSWVFLYSADTVAAGLTRMLTVNLVLVAAALLARWFVPLLPSTATLDGIAHRTIAFGFVLWTVGTIAGAMWAEQSWGRFWGWDPKETGAFLTWIAYAGYLHARATTGIKGRRAAWIGIWSFVVLMGTYLIANYVIVGLHSYAGL